MASFDECYNISDQIIDKYVEFITSPLYVISGEMYENMVIEIRKLVMIEYKMIHSMSIEELDKYLEDTFNNDDEDKYDEATLTRIKNRMSNYRDVLQDKSINARELEIKVIPEDLEFSLYDSILSYFSIETIKKLKDKIYSLSNLSKQDRNFVNELKNKLKRSLIDFVFSPITAEIIALHYNVDIDKIPSIDIEKVKNKIELLDDRDVAEGNIVMTLAAYTKMILDRLLDFQTVNNNPDEVFSYLVMVTRMEVLISYMDINMLESVCDYCNKISNGMNMPTIDNIKRLVKERINERK